jgi:5-methylcytosine-specific restriction enzyme subunit McrC
MTCVIPIANLYYLYCYAWERFAEGKALAVDAEASPDLPNLLTRVLANGMHSMFRRGLDRVYVSLDEDLATVRGHIEIGASLRLQAQKIKRLHCSYDELSHDVLHNQILKASLRRLGTMPSLAADLKAETQSLVRRMHDVSDIRLTHSCFARVQLNRNSAYYDLLLKVAQLAFDLLLPVPGAGAYKFQDITRNEREMARVFEAFVRNFYKLEQSSFKVEPLTINWDAVPLERGEGDRLPSMRVDVFLRSPQRQLIIDTKYYFDALQMHHGAHSFRSENLYQLFSYLKNHNVRIPSGTQLDGMLLYPQVGSQFDAQFAIQGSTVRLATVDLGRPWHEISERLLGLIASPHNCIGADS